MRQSRLWIILALVTVGSFAVLGFFGVRIQRSLPPIPTRVVGTDGTVLIDGDSIQRGQNVWQSLGGQQIGTVWGHGAYVAPDWSADWLHRESVFVLDTWARQEGAVTASALPPERQAALQSRLQQLMRTNTYDAGTNSVVLDPLRVQAYRANAAHFADVFAHGRAEYAIPEGALVDTGRMNDMAAFFWWTSWVASTNRPGDTATYTQNWPAESLVGNKPTSGVLLWSMISVVLLIGGIGALVWYHAAHGDEDEVTARPPATDPFFGMKVTPSQRATAKYFLVVVALLVLQVGLGAVTAHFGVEGQGFFGIPLGKYLPYAVTRSWHTQLGIFWIATAWLATGLFVAPGVSGYEPKWQRAGVNFLFVCLVIIVAGTLVGQWLSVQQRLHGDLWYWFGHQGYEYVDLGRFWQIFLFVGLFVWLGLMARALWPALKRPSESRPLLVLFLVSSLAIAAFYGAGLMYGKNSHLVTTEYWRWWVVHLWVEGFFEVFAVVVISFLLVRMGLVEVRKATNAVVFSTIIFLGGGVLGTFHHLYFTGTPAAVLALGSVFSAFEIVPLTVVGYEAWKNQRIARLPGWVRAYRWPLAFFVAVAFWNLVGAGVFGFLINPPIALYYMQGLNLTPVHGHTALFGVYGMLGIGLMLFSLRALKPELVWNERPLAVAFWYMNVGLSVMVLLSMLPIGLLQTYAAVEHGTWWARSAEFMQTPLMQTLRWLRMPGDTLFAIGILSLAWFIFRLRLGGARVRMGVAAEGQTGELLPEGLPAGALSTRAAAAPRYDA